MILNESNQGDKLIIMKINADDSIKKRLQDMGLTRGTTFRVMAYYFNNAIILNIRGSRVVIDNNIAKNIEVELFKCNRRQGRHRHQLLNPTEVESMENLNRGYGHGHGRHCRKRRFM